MKNFMKTVLPMFSASVLMVMLSCSNNPGSGGNSSSGGGSPGGGTTNSVTTNVFMAGTTNYMVINATNVQGFSFNITNFSTTNLPYFSNMIVSNVEIMFLWQNITNTTYTNTLITNLVFTIIGYTNISSVITSSETNDIYFTNSFSLTNCWQTIQDIYSTNYQAVNITNVLGTNIVSTYFNTTNGTCVSNFAAVSGTVTNLWKNITNCTITNAVTNTIGAGTNAWILFYSYTNNTYFTNTFNTNLVSVYSTGLAFTVMGGQITITNYGSPSGNIVIPSTINGYPVVSIGSNAFYYCTNLTSVVIPNTVTSIGVGAFDSCTSLTSVVIPNSVVSIGVRAFINCASLTNVVIPNSVVNIDNYAFAGCIALKSLSMDRLTAPTLGDSSFQSVSSCTLHIHSGTTGYNVAPWTTTSIFSSIVTDLP